MEALRKPRAMQREEEEREEEARCQNRRHGKLERWSPLQDRPALARGLRPPTCLCPSIRLEQTVRARQEAWTSGISSGSGNRGPAAKEEEMADVEAGSLPLKSTTSLIMKKAGAEGFRSQAEEVKATKVNGVKTPT